MAIWPFRSRPTVAPFTDPYSIRAYVMGQAINADRLLWAVPDRVYIHPIALRYTVTLLPGIHGLDLSEVQFSSGGLIFAHSSPCALVAASTASICFADFGQPYTPAIGLLAWCQMLPSPICLYPNDLITFRFRNWILGDTIDLAVIYAKFWEVY
jgi:hypothetical protein